MREIAVTTNIPCRKELVWNKLTDIQDYSSWNPFICSVHGNLQNGSTLELGIINPQGIKLDINARITKLLPPHELRWKSKLIMTGILGVEEFFILRDIEGESTAFTHGVRFTGIFMSFFTASLQRLKPALESMNEALKKTYELAE